VKVSSSTRPQAVGKWFVPNLRCSGYYEASANSLGLFVSSRSTKSSEMVDQCVAEWKAKFSQLGGGERTRGLERGD
jgi:hypothetical protein